MRKETGVAHWNTDYGADDGDPQEIGIWVREAAELDHQICGGPDESGNKRGGEEGVSIEVFLQGVDPPDLFEAKELELLLGEHAEDHVPESGHDKD